MSETLGEMVLIRYVPFEGCEVVAPSIRPGQQLLVTPTEAERMLAFDSFELAESPADAAQ